MVTLKKKKQSPAARVADALPDASDAADRVAEAVEAAGARLGKQAENVGELAREFGGQVGDQFNQVRRDATKRARGAEGSLKNARAAAREKLATTGTDAVIKAQLAKTTRELAHESADLNGAVESLNAVIKANRKAGARGRSRLYGGLALGAVVMYHLDPAQGRQRRAASARKVVALVRSTG